MTRTAMYEVHEGNEDLKKAGYYKTDYVSLHMWRTAVAVTLAYLLIAFLVIACNFEYFINNLTRLNYTVLGVILGVAYGGMMAFFLLISYFVYAHQYDVAEKGIRIYQNRLHKIFMLNKKEKERKGEK